MGLGYQECKGGMGSKEIRFMKQVDPGVRLQEGHKNDCKYILD